MSRVVTVKSLTKKYKYATFFSCPHETKGGFLTGAKHLPGKFKDSKYAIKPSDRPAIQHAQPLDLDNEKDACFYAYLLDLEEVANRLAVATPDTHLFYLEDPQEEAVLSNLKDELMMEAFELVSNNSSVEAKENLMYFLGNNPKGKSPDVIKHIIFNTCKNNPQKIIDGFSESGKYVRFVNELIMNGIIKQKSQTYYFNEHVLGTGIDEAVLFVMNEKNNKVIESMGAHLNSVGAGTGHALEETRVLTFHDGKQEAVNLARVDELLAEYNVSCPPMWKFNGKFNALQKHLDSLKT